MTARCLCGTRDGLLRCHRSAPGLRRAGGTARGGPGTSGGHRPRQQHGPRRRAHRAPRCPGRRPPRRPLRRTPGVPQRGGRSPAGPPSGPGPGRAALPRTASRREGLPLPATSARAGGGAPSLSGLARCLAGARSAPPPPPPPSPCEQRPPPSCRCTSSGPRTP